MYKELNVKVGDTVLYHHGSTYGHRLPAITKVAKITPTGRIRVELYPSEQFDKYGKRMGNTSWSRPYLEVPTDERLQEVAKKTFIRRLVQKLQSKVTEENISYEQAVAIDEILKDGVANET